MANLITGLRIIFSIAMLFFPALSSAFYVFYIVAGITDIIDGTIARKTNSESEFGSKLDTIADFIMIVVCFLKLWPVLDFEKWMYVWIAIIAFIKALNIFFSFVIYRKYFAIHSMMNKVTGGMLFLLPFTLKMIPFRYSMVIVCMVATFAAIQEGYFIRKDREEK